MKTSIITLFDTSLHQSILHVFSISANLLLRPFWLHLFAIFVLIAEFASSYLSSSLWKGHSNVHCCWNLISSRHSSTSQTIISPNGLPSTGFFSFPARFSQVVLEILLVFTNHAMLHCFLPIVVERLPQDDTSLLTTRHKSTTFFMPTARVLWHKSRTPLG